MAGPSGVFGAAPTSVLLGKTLGRRVTATSPRLPLLSACVIILPRDGVYHFAVCRCLPSIYSVERGFQLDGRGSDPEESPGSAGQIAR